MELECFDFFRLVFPKGSVLARWGGSGLPLFLNAKDCFSWYFKKMLFCPDGVALSSEEGADSEILEMTVMPHRANEGQPKVVIGVELCLSAYQVSY